MSYEGDYFTQDELDAPDYRGKMTKITICSITKPTGPWADIYLYHKTLKQDKKGKDRDVDALHLSSLFEKQTSEGLRVLDIVQDIDYDTFIDGLKNDKTLKGYRYFLFAFLTYADKDGHEGEEVKLHFADSTVRITQLLDDLKDIPALVGKPKILLVQADRYVLKVTQQVDMLKPREEEMYKKIKIPTDADILVMISTLPKHRSRPASTLIEAFSKLMAQNFAKPREEQTDLLTMTVEMNASFLDLYPGQTNADDDSQLPIVTSTLRKVLYL